jgi:Flp pilus assembly protein TadD
VFSDLTRDLDARNAYRRAIALKPDLVEALSALAGLLLLDGNISEALDLSRRALALNESPKAKAVVAACLQ